MTFISTITLPKTQCRAGGALPRPRGQIHDLLIVVNNLEIGIHYIGAGITALSAAANVGAAHVGAAGLAALLSVQLLDDGVECLGQLLSGILDGLGISTLQSLLQLVQSGLHAGLILGR